MPAARTATATRPATQRSRATNGKSLFAAGGSMSGAWARRLRDLYEAHLVDLGGMDAVSEAEKAIVRRASVLEVQCEAMEASFSVQAAEAAELDLYQRMSNTMRRLFESVGLKRVARDVTPDLSAYVKGQAA